MAQKSQSAGSHRDAIETKKEEVEHEQYLEEEDAEASDIDYATFYDKNKLIIGPRQSANYAYRRNRPFFQIHYSFGYDCYKRGNIQMIDSATIVYASGNYVHFFNVKTLEKKYIRSINGYGIGHITLHPLRTHLVVAEKGVKNFPPNIYIYDSKTLELWKILRGGAEITYAFITFNPTGSLLASVAGEPDYMITVWDWKRELIILRSKAYFNDVYVVAFSPFSPGFLTTAGVGHIKFWKMAKTFTGLKLQGSMGRFGRTEVSNIDGLIQFPDGKVLSGSEWGNFLLWDAGLIKVEIVRRMGKNCHSSNISQFLLDEGEILSVGSDGYVKVWQMETLDAADATDDRGFFETEPLNELQIGPNVHLMYAVKCLDNEHPNTWYAQDRNGGIWKLDFSFSYASKVPEKTLSCHAGAIKGMDVSPISHLFATTGVDGSVRLHDMLSKVTLIEKHFSSSGTALLWFPKDFNPMGNLIAVGFADGTLRILSIEPGVSIYNDVIVEFHLKVCQKPHNEEISGIAFYSETKFLFTSSLDKTVFIFQWINDTLNPIGFVSISAPVSSICCSPAKFSPKSVFVTCLNGEMGRFDIPDMGKKMITALAKKKSYCLDNELKPMMCTFRSIKSEIRRGQHFKEKVLKRANLSRILEEKKGAIETSGTKESEDSTFVVEDDEEYEPVYVPVVPSPILLGFCTQRQFRFWISVGGYDSGYLYEYAISSVETTDWDDEPKYSLSSEPVGILTIDNSDDVPVHSVTFSADGIFAVLGFENGRLMVLKLFSAWILNSVDYHWGDRLHDCDYGTIYNVKFSYDQKFLISCGGDGNMFCCTFDGASAAEDLHAAIPEESEVIEDKLGVIDVTDPIYPTLEEERNQLEFGKFMKLVDRKKQLLLQHIRQLQNNFFKMLESNRFLPLKMQINRQEIVATPRLRRELMDEFSEMEKQTNSELAWEAEKYKRALEKLKSRFKDDVNWESLKIKAINRQVTVSTFRLMNLNKLIEEAIDSKFDDIQVKVSTTIQEATKSESPIFSDEPIKGGIRMRKIDTISVTLNRHVQRVLQRIGKQRDRKQFRDAEWNALKAQKPSELRKKADEKAIEVARKNIGFFNLKSSEDYTVPDHLRLTTKRKLKELVEALYCTHSYKEQFNKKVFALRNRKQQIIKRVEWISNRLNTLQKKMQLSERRAIPTVPRMEEYEIPEENLRTALTKLASAADSTSTVGTLDKHSKAAGMKFRVSVVSAMMAAPAKPRASMIVTKSQVPGFPQMQTPEYGDRSPSSGSDLHTALQMRLGWSPMEQRLHKMKLIKNMADQDDLILEAALIVKKFDDDISAMVEEKQRLLVALKEGEMCHVLLYAELKLLSQFESQEEGLLHRMDIKTDEKTDIQNKIHECQQRIDMRKRESDRIHEQERVLLQELYTMLGEHNKFGNFLTKVYKKRVKRVKKKELTGDEEEEDEESSESDDEYDIMDEDEDDEFVNDKDCPEGCDQLLFESVLTLREKRLDLEELYVEGKRHTDQLKKEIEVFSKRLKNVEVGLKALQTDFKRVQHEKQCRLNEVDVTIPLKQSQVQYIMDGEVPSDISDCLIFPSTGLKILEARILELQQEGIVLRKKLKENKRFHLQLVKECATMDDKIFSLQAKCENTMIEKFGCRVNLETLESHVINRSVEELKQQVKTLEQAQEHEKFVWSKKKEKHQRDIVGVVCKNTQHIVGMNNVFTKLKAMEQQFVVQQRHLPRDLLPDKEKQKGNELKLKLFIACQQRKIENLQDQVKKARDKSFCFSNFSQQYLKRSRWDQLTCKQKPIVKNEEEETVDKTADMMALEEAFIQLLLKQLTDKNEGVAEASDESENEKLVMKKSSSPTGLADVQEKLPLIVSRTSMERFFDDEISIEPKETISDYIGRSDSDDSESYFEDVDLNLR